MRGIWTYLVRQGCYKVHHRIPSIIRPLVQNRERNLGSWDLENGVWLSVCKYSDTCMSERLGHWVPLSPYLRVVNRGELSRDEGSILKIRSWCVDFLMVFHLCMYWLFLIKIIGCAAKMMFGCQNIDLAPTLGLPWYYLACKTTLAPPQWLYQKLYQKTEFLS